jgi:hypothetical protein
MARAKAMMRGVAIGGRALMPASGAVNDKATDALNQKLSICFGREIVETKQECYRMA